MEGAVLPTLTLAPPPDPLDPPEPPEVVTVLYAIISTISPSKAGDNNVIEVPLVAIYSASGERLTPL